MNWVVSGKKRGVAGWILAMLEILWKFQLMSKSSQIHDSFNISAKKVDSMGVLFQILPPSISNIGHAWQKLKLFFFRSVGLGTEAIEDMEKRPHLVPTRIAICWMPIQYPQSPRGARQRLKSMGPICMELPLLMSPWVRPYDKLRCFLDIPTSKNRKVTTSTNANKKNDLDVFAMVRLCGGAAHKSKVGSLKPLNKPESSVTQ